MKNHRNALYFLPAILWLGIIFFLSGQTGEETASLSLALTRWLMQFFPNVPEAALHMGLSKAAHVEVYFVEGALLYPALRPVGLSNILDREGRENVSGSSPKKGTHGTGVAPTLVGS